VEHWSPSPDNGKEDALGKAPHRDKHQIAPPNTPQRSARTASIIRSLLTVGRRIQLSGGCGRPRKRLQLHTNKFILAKRLGFALERLPKQNLGK
jgi:hypothetical protein